MLAGSGLWAAAGSQVPGGDYAQLSQWGVLGVAVMVLAAFAKTAYADVKAQRDGAQADNAAINFDMREKYVPALRDSENALRQALSLVSGMSVDNARLIEVLNRTNGLLEESRAVLVRNTEAYSREVVPALRAATEVARVAAESVAEARKETEMRDRIRAELQQQKKLGGASGGDLVEAAG